MDITEKIRETIEEQEQEEEYRANSKVRVMQAIQGDKAFLLCVPKAFVADLRMAKGDYVRCWISNNRLIVEKACT